jgi:hypothetical protein
MDTLLSPTFLFLAFVSTTAVLAIAVEWRISLLALLVQYVAVGLLIGRFVSVQAAAVKVFVGVLACVILYLSARATEPHLEGAAFISDSYHRALVWSPTVNDLLLRALAVAVVGTGILSTGLSQVGFEGTNVTLAPAVWLAMLGLVFLALARAAFAAGLGLLTLQTGFEVFYAAIDSSPLTLGLLAIAHVVLVLGIVYGISQYAPGGDV